MAVILQPALRIVDRKAHLRFLTAQPQLVKQAHKARIGAIVIHDESGIDGPGTLRRGDIHRGGMPPRRGRRFEQGHFVSPGKAPGTGQPGNAAANNRDFHGRTILRNSLR